MTKAQLKLIIDGYNASLTGLNAAQQGWLQAMSNGIALTSSQTTDFNANKAAVTATQGLIGGYTALFNAATS